MEKWKILDSKYIHKGPWATLRCDKLKLPNGHIKEEYYVLEYPHWVNMVAFTEDEKIILIQQYRHGAEKVMLEIPAGVIEEGETPEEAAQRELLEETGYAFESIEKVSTLYANPATSGNLTYTFLLKGGRKVQEQDSDASEDIKVYTYSPEEVKKLLLENKIEQSLHSSALFYAFIKTGLL